MGTWGVENFENDDALDWVLDLEKAKDESVLVEAFDQFEKGDEEDPAGAGDCALAAAEVVAALKGNPPEDCPEEVSTWIKGRPAPPTAIVEQARRVTQQILEKSETRDLWAESEYFDAWQKTIGDLLQRLE
ncbi:hypothetical protein Pan216_14230 [Planctomycetes bacterium Pan216]|uniref:DUF4259 domain-containing protein n=2 Tax=Kolteria novifilia TaxID=2527975 RepID=A0A518B0U3_9BACT|nr:hypothetical protein Pan216_14230 [Planctomycetes bacterium Pan216]